MAIVAVLRAKGVTTLVLPAGQLLALAGLVAAIAPSRRAARLPLGFGRRPGRCEGVPVTAGTM